MPITSFTQTRLAISLGGKALFRLAGNHPLQFSFGWPRHIFTILMHTFGREFLEAHCSIKVCAVVVATLLIYGFHGANAP